MKTWLGGFGIMLALLLWVTSAHARPLFVVFYVGTNGNDAWSGKLAEPNQTHTDGPFATLERAKEAARKVRQTPPLRNFAGVRILLRGGTYALRNGFKLTREDSGEAGAPTLYSNYPRETVRLIGGREVTGFTPVTAPEILKRMDPLCQGHVYQADLPAQGITDFGTLMPNGQSLPSANAALELFFQDRPMTLARWPNQGWATIAGTPQGQNGGMFTYQGDRPERWKQAEDIWLHGYWTWDWADSYTRVKSIDYQAHAIYTTPPHGAYGYTPGKRYYALNLLEELDSPGEWYLDRKTGLLYFWPPAPLTEGHAFVSLLDSPLIQLENASYVTLRGLTIEVTRGAGVEIRNGVHDRVEGCVLRNLGTVGVAIEGGEQNGVADCDLYETGQGGISLSGGDRKTLTPGANYAENNCIHDYSRIVRCYRPGVQVDGVGNIVAHNLIYNGPHNAIQLSGNEHRIEYNEVHDVCRETGDVGAFYMGRDWTMRGNVIRYNYFHHLGGFKGQGFTDAMAIYLDDAASGATVYGNLCYKAGRAVLIGGGRDNTVENNLFIDCAPAVHVDARGVGWAKRYIAEGGEWQMYEKLAAVNYLQPPYSVKYPALAAIRENDPAMAKGDALLHNVCVNGKWLELQDGLTDRTIRIEGNTQETLPPNGSEAEPVAASLARAARAPGFKPLPFAEMGLVKDEVRRQLPPNRAPDEPAR